MQVTLFSAPNYCGEFDNAGGMMSVDETLMCSFQVRLVKLLMMRMIVMKRMMTTKLEEALFASYL